MKRFRHPLFALLLSLLLVGAQQAAFAHLLSHVQGRAQIATQYQDDHGYLDGAAEACAACLAFSAVGGGAAPTADAFAATFAAGDNYFLPLADAVFTRSTLTARARAPPPVL